jgi:hypothetical protein
VTDASHLLQMDVDDCILSSAVSCDLTEGVVHAAATLWHIDIAASRQVPLIVGHAQHVSSFVTCPIDTTLLVTTCHAGPLRVWQVNKVDVRLCPHTVC